MHPADSFCNFAITPDFSASVRTWGEPARDSKLRIRSGRIPDLPHSPARRPAQRAASCRGPLRSARAIRSRHAHIATHRRDVPTFTAVLSVLVG